MEIKDINLDDYEISQQADEEIIVLRKKPKYPKWDDLNKISGKYITPSSNIYHIACVDPVPNNRNTFLTEKHVKSALAMAQISQLMPYYGGEITNEEWLDISAKFTIERNNIKIYTEQRINAYKFLAFHTEEQRDEFLKNNEQLVKDYLMIE